MTHGFVYLVGAGPGDPGLLTLRAADLLRRAEVVAYDELVSPAILAMAASDAELLNVGRRHGHGAIAYRVHPEVLARARAGRFVVRLKAGDPLVFGRGGEEAEELHDAGIPFEIVPGVSAALGAASYAGIPLTHRDHASQVTFATGHDARRARGDGTLVLYMAGRRLAENTRRLIDEGRAPETPAAYVASATTPEQRVVVGTLGDLAARVAGLDPCAPAIVFVGDVVSVRSRAAWFERRALRGVRVLVARARPGPSEIASALRDRGAEVIEAPHVAIVPGDPATIDQALAPGDRWDRIVFACEAGVEAVLGRTRPTFDAPVVAIGQAAARALIRAGVGFEVVDGACDRSLRARAALFAGKRVLVVTGDDGRPMLTRDLEALGATVERLTAYARVSSMVARLPSSIDLVVLPSSSAARAILAGPHGPALRRVRMVAMGPRSAEAARALGASRITLSERDDVRSVVTAAEQLLVARPGPCRRQTASPLEIEP